MADTKCKSVANLHVDYHTKPILLTLCPIFTQMRFAFDYRLPYLRLGTSQRILR